MRTRSSNTLVAVGGTDRAVDTSCGHTVTNTDVPAVAYVGEKSLMIDVVTPRFRQRQKAGELIINPMRREFQSQAISGDGPGFKSTGQTCTNPVKYGYWYNDGPQMGKYAYGLNSTGYTCPRIITAAETSAVISLATTSCWESTRASSADILTDIAELKQTLSMLRRPFQSVQTYIGKTFSRYRQKHGRAAKDLREAMAGTWLEMRYGWRPLVGSIGGVLQAATAPRVHDRQTYRGKSAFTKEGVVTQGVADFGSGTVTWQCTVHEVITIRAGIIRDEVVTLRSRLGVDLAGIMSLPWELFPYSFVADWFANVGSFIKALAASLGESGSTGWYTQRNEITALYQPLVTTPISIRSVARSATCTATVKRVEITRVPGLPRPSFAFKPESILSIVDWRHGLDGVLLIAQRFR